MSRLWTIAVLAALSGCVSSGTKVTEQQADQFEKGKSTEADVIAKLGAPTSSSRAADGARADVYMYTKSQARAASFIPVVGLLAGGADATMMAVIFHFTPDGVLKDWTSNVTNAGANTGLLNQQ
jgi:outer membrane protein assembly factor BamE (lipoprotein component of BamABCDE complex)